MTDNTFPPTTFEVDQAWGGAPGEGWDRYDFNVARAESAGLDACVICGRGVKANSGSQVHFVHGGNSAVRNDLTPAEVGEEGSGDMGYWTLGPECQKKVPSAYRHPRNTGYNARP